MRSAANVSSHEQRDAIELNLIYENFIEEPNMERLDRIDCTIGMVLTFSIVALTLWGYTQDSSIHLNVRSEQTSVTATAK
ncbi:hypothetical protein CKA32_004763 [Geitlerinema sp. FC II]|uniref:hypothetical protein n=1 Tax=Baaleninema simplex TaxID=2862350 RepID=UPI001181B319|nr:hypothetical protein [Baaleninema simplex]MDC0835998.1 hypothetical protein [Geitlerinema sp. CS-897]PPT06690.1 hypothetical protein CKA32_004763 [Geitlerinema sp. FC II]